MRLLAIDTAEIACSAALLIDGEVVERFEIAPRRHSELILGMMQSLLDEAGLRLADMDALAFGRGPGSFTGLRIAAAVIQGSAWGADLPVVAVSNLRGVAQGVHREQGASKVLAGFDARMGEVYWGAFELAIRSFMTMRSDKVKQQRDTLSLKTSIQAITVAYQARNFDKLVDVFNNRSQAAAESRRGRPPRCSRSRSAWRRAACPQPGSDNRRPGDPPCTSS